MKKLATDAMFKLEYDGKDVAKKNDQSAPDLTALEMQQSTWKDDYIINYVLRKELRVTTDRSVEEFFSTRRRTFSKRRKKNASSAKPTID